MGPDTPTFGILHDFRRPVADQRPYDAYYAECLDEVAEADRLGFDAVWLSEHHSTVDGMVPSPLVLIAAPGGGKSVLMARTTTDVLGSRREARVRAVDFAGTALRGV